MKRKSKLLIAAALTGAVCFALYFANAEAMPEKKFAVVSVGMSEANVRDLLGIPHLVRQDAVASTAFFYDGFRRGKWCSMEVFFGPDGKVTGKLHDH